MATPFAQDLEFQKLLDGRLDIELVTLLLELAGDAYPDLDRLSVLAELDRLGRGSLPGRESKECRRRCAAQLEAISQLLYVDECFCGNTGDYYDPRNSYLNEVLRRRTGIPISLAIVYMAVAGQAGVAMHGVPTPAHFMLGCKTQDETLFVDPFAGGDVLTREGCRRRVEQMAGRALPPADHWFRAATPGEIAVRVLRNLKATYVRRDEWNSVVPVQQRLSLLVPDNAAEQRDLGLVYLRSGRPQPALRLLEAYAELCAGPQAEEVQPYLRVARRLVAELN